MILNAKSATVVIVVSMSWDTVHADYKWHLLYIEKFIPRFSPRKILARYRLSQVNHRRIAKVNVISWLKLDLLQFWKSTRKFCSRHILSLAAETRIFVLGRTTSSGSNWVASLNQALFTASYFAHRSQDENKQQKSMMRILPFFFTTSCKSSFSSIRLSTFPWT